MRLNSRSSISCHEFLHKTYAPNRFAFAELSERSSMAQEIARLGSQHEQRVIDLLKSKFTNWVDIDRRLSQNLREEQSADALFNPDIDVIIGASIMELAEKEITSRLGLTNPLSSHRASSPDILFRAPGTDRNFPMWIPIDVKSHGAFEKNTGNEIWQTAIDGKIRIEDSKIAGRIKRDDALQLSHYVTHLADLGIGFYEPIAGIIGRDGEFITWANLHGTTFGKGLTKETALGLYLKQFEAAFAVVKQAMNRNEDPSIPAPAIPIYDGDAKKCPTCQFKKMCLDEMKQYRGSGHVTLLADVTPSTLPSLNVDSIADLALDTSAKPELQQRARVYQSGIPEILVNQAFDVPTFDIEIDIDLENSQGSLQEIGVTENVEPDRVFLYGYIKHDRTKLSEWDSNNPESFENYGGNEDSEFEVLSRMWNYLVQEVNHAKLCGKTVGIFHYGPVERTWFKRFASRYGYREGVPKPEQAEAFMDNYFHDLLKTAKLLAFPPSKQSPLCNYSIKTLAPLIPFKWHVEDGNGAEALVKYKEAFELHSETAQNWLRCYNWDDVRATMALRNWIRDGMPRNQNPSHRSDCNICISLNSK